MTAFHWKNLALGASTALPGFEYGPNQRDHSLPGSSVLPERTKNSRRGSPPDELADFAPLAVAGGGPHQSSRPHWEKSCASNERDSNVPSGSYSGPTEKTFPVALRAMPVIWAEPALASCAKTPWPSIASSEPLLPVPAKTRPSEANPR